MNLEVAAAKGELADLTLKIVEAEMGIEEERRHLREATGPVVTTRGLDAVRITFLVARLVAEIEKLKLLDARARELREGYGI
jgi:TATA-binding protein-associated factor Taf7